jgi:DNA gyrase/topoisomerase IV subunit A
MVESFSGSVTHPWRNALFTPEKIEEWLAEVAERPASASIIIQFIANRINDLNTWNEELRAENAKLRTGERVAEFERQIAHLQYQLELVKRQFGGQMPTAEQRISAAPEESGENLNVLIYTPDGRLQRLDLDTGSLAEGAQICNLGGILLKEVVPRLLVIPSQEELLFLFDSGRIATLPVEELPAHPASNPIDWETAPIPNAPQAGDQLACLAPISNLALADYFLQISQRGYIKKIRMALAPSIMENHYIGRGAKISHDRPHDLALCRADERYVLVSKMGYLQYVPVDLSPHAIVEAIHLKSADRLAAAFALPEGKSVLVMTQIGKAIHRTPESLEMVADLGRVGKALYSKTRREAGVQVVGAAAVAASDWGLALHANGQISTHAIAEIFANGTLPVADELLVFTTFSG